MDDAKIFFRADIYLYNTFTTYLRSIDNSETRKAQRVGNILNSTQYLPYNILTSADILKPFTDSDSWSKSGSNHIKNIYKPLRMCAAICTFQTIKKVK